LCRKRHAGCRRHRARVIPSCRGAITGAGNIYRHDYDNVVERIVWQTVTRDLAPLLATVEAELARDANPQ
jgi:hypothetical protein